MATAVAARRGAPPPFFSADHQRGLTSLLSQTYNKPVQLNLVKLNRPHQDPDILAQVVAAKLKDRKNAPRRIIRDAAWRAQLPTQVAITKKTQERLAREASRTPLQLSDLTVGGEKGKASVSEALRDMTLSEVSSVSVEAGGRLSKRITANRAQGKVAIRGLTKKGPTHMVRGAVKGNTAHAQRAGKRRIGSYGVRVTLGYS